MKHLQLPFSKWKRNKNQSEEIKKLQQLKLFVTQHSEPVDAKIESARKKTHTHKYIPIVNNKHPQTKYIKLSGSAFKLNIEQSN